LWRLILQNIDKKNSYAMHTVKITPNLLFEYQCTSGEFIRLTNRMEKNRSGSKNRMETFSARIGMFRTDHLYGLRVVDVGAERHQDGRHEGWYVVGRRQHTRAQSDDAGVTTSHWLGVG